MSKRSKKRSKARPAKPISINKLVAQERKPLYLSKGDVEMLLDHLQQLHGVPQYLIAQLRQLHQGFMDTTQRLKEIEARAKANGHWERPSEWDVHAPSAKNLKRRLKRR